jgi:hypothetical protein
MIDVSRRMTGARTEAWEIEGVKADLGSRGRELSSPEATIKGKRMHQQDIHG